MMTRRVRRYIPDMLCGGGCGAYVPPYMTHCGAAKCAEVVADTARLLSLLDAATRPTPALREGTRAEEVPDVR